MARKTINEQAQALLADEDAMGRFVSESAVEAMLLARRVMNGDIKAPVNTRITAAQKVLDNAKMIIEELRGHEQSRQRKRGSAPTKSSSAAGTRQTWGRGNTEHNADGTPVALGEPPVELPDRSRPPQ